MKYDKLVRDRIPEIIKDKNPRIRTANQTEYKRKLREKILEESKELLDNASREELADILEAIECYIRAEKWNKREIGRIKKKKSAERGSFKKRIILMETD